MKNLSRILKTNRLSTKIILMVEVVLILSNSIFCVVSIINSRVGIRQSIQQRMLDIANCAAGSVNGDMLESLTAEDQGTPEYQRVFDTLAIFRDNVELEYVYAIQDEGNGRYTFSVDTDPVSPGEFGSPVEYTEALAAAADGRASVDKVPYTDAWGSFYSAYSPVFDSAGKVAGIVAADFSVDWYNSQLSQRTREIVASYSIILLLTLLFAALMTLVAVSPFVQRQEQLAEEVKQKAEENEQLFIQIVRSLADAVDAKDRYTNGHSRRVSQYSMALAEALGWDEERIKTLRYAAMLHDIGKIGVPDSILNKPSQLSEVEYGIIKSHAAMGGDILSNGIMTETAANVARSHHEWYDGSGYPRGLKGEEIEEEARIVAIADAFDTMSSNRVYRRACEPDHIRKELEEGRGKQFDPEMTDRFIELWDQGKLDPIMENSVEEEEEVSSAPSAKLKEVVDAFLAQAMHDEKPNGQTGDNAGTADSEDAETDTTDVGRIIDGIQKNGNYSGALKVDYGQFAQLYQYISNIETRLQRPFQLALISLDPAPGEEPTSVELEREMGFMEQSIRRTIRSVDILTRYGKHEFLVILVGTGADGAKTSVDRIFRDYFKISGNSVYMPSNIISEMD